MKLLTYKLKGDDKERLGMMCSFAFHRFIPIEDLGLHFRDMNDLIQNMTREQRTILEHACEKPNKRLLCYEDVVRCAPIPHPRQDIICLGLNFRDHAVESSRFKKEEFNQERPYAVYFSKRVNEATPDGGCIPSYPGLVDSLDYEAELAVIIGKEARNVSEEQVKHYLFGYTIINDISARNIQNRHKQWYFGKSLDGFLPMGPCIVTTDALPYPPKLSIRSKVNGELRQDSNTSMLIFGIDHVVSELSRGIALKAGTIISMGTPAGVGMGFDPPKFLKPGDRIDCIVEGIGTLSNHVV